VPEVSSGDGLADKECRASTDCQSTCPLLASTYRDSEPALGSGASPSKAAIELLLLSEPELRDEVEFEMAAREASRPGWLNLNFGTESTA
jgi:hypothetical protein